MCRLYGHKERIAYCSVDNNYCFLGSLKHTLSCLKRIVDFVRRIFYVLHKRNRVDDGKNKFHETLLRQHFRENARSVRYTNERRNRTAIKKTRIGRVANTEKKKKKKEDLSRTPPPTMRIVVNIALGSVSAAGRSAARVARRGCGEQQQQ